MTLLDRKCLIVKTAGKVIDSRMLKMFKEKVWSLVLFGTAIVRDDSLGKVITHKGFRVVADAMRR
jgi:hypothetical protein